MVGLDDPFIIRKSTEQGGQVNDRIKALDKMIDLQPKEGAK